MKTFYDYKHQAYVVNGVYVACGHLDDCGCWGKEHEGEQGCQHENTSSMPDGNIGGFSKFIRHCKDCLTQLPEEY
jgi:hypothetical protein